MRRRLRLWWRAAVQPAVHDIQIAATQYAFEPATIEVTAGESVRLLIRWKDVVHGFSIPDLTLPARNTVAAGTAR